MFYYYRDTPFRGKTIRFIRADASEQSLSDGLIAILKLTHEENENVVAVIKSDGNIIHSFRHNEEQQLWRAYLVEHPLLYDEYYQWIREWANI